MVFGLCVGFLFMCLKTTYHESTSEATLPSSDPLSYVVCRVENKKALPINQKSF
jgi:hypothetical protein